MRTAVNVQSSEAFSRFCLDSPQHSSQVCLDFQMCVVRCNQSLTKSHSWKYISRRKCVPAGAYRADLLHRFPQSMDSCLAF